MNCRNNFIEMQLKYLFSQIVQKCGSMRPFEEKIYTCVTFDLKIFPCLIERHHSQIESNVNMCRKVFDLDCRLLFGMLPSDLWTVILMSEIYCIHTCISTSPLYSQYHQKALQAISFSSNKFLNSNRIRSQTVLSSKYVCNI